MHYAKNESFWENIWDRNRADIKHTFIGTIATKKELLHVLIQPIPAFISILVNAVVYCAIFIL